MSSSPFPLVNLFLVPSPRASLRHHRVNLACSHSCHHLAGVPALPGTRHFLPGNQGLVDGCPEAGRRRKCWDGEGAFKAVARSSYVPRLVLGDPSVSWEAGVRCWAGGEAGPLSFGGDSPGSGS